MLPRPVLLLFAAAPVVAAGPSVSVDGITAQQAVFSIGVADAARCSVQIYSDANRTRPVDDTNETLFHGSTACNRTGSVVEQSRVVFVAGLRTSQLATDGRMHSRSLAANTTYYYSITDLLKGQMIKGQFTTGNLPAGNTYPEPVPFDPNGFANAAYPVVDLGGNGQGCGSSTGNAAGCVDPVTGLQYWLFT